MNDTPHPSSPQAIFASHLSDHHLRYPDERLVALFARHFGTSGRISRGWGLDIGCGGGRHLALLEDLGFEVAGIDYTAKAIEVTRTAFAQRSSNWKLAVAELAEAERPDAAFAVVIAWGVLFLKSRDEVLADLRHIRSLLQPDGLLFANFRGRENWLWGLGETIEPDTFLLDDRAKEYAGLLYYFTDMAEIETLAAEAGFAVIDHERLDLWKRDLTEHNSWWIVALKPISTD